MEDGPGAESKCLSLLHDRGVDDLPAIPEDKRSGGDMIPSKLVVFGCHVRETYRFLRVSDM